MKNFFLAFFSIITLHLSYASAQQDNWKLELNKNDVKIWTRKLENSNLKECKMLATMNTSVDKLLGIFTNHKLYEKFMYKTKPGSVKLVKKVSEDDFYVYMVATAPLVKDRDIVIHFTIDRNQPNGSIVMNMDANSWNLVEKQESCVRITKMKGMYKFTPTKDGKVEIFHQSYSYPGGGIPESLANFVVTDAPYSLVQKIRDLLN